MKRLAVSLKKYFWDVEFRNISIEKHRVYILKRILEYGDEDAVGWMRSNFKDSEIREVLCKFRGFSLKSANFWAIALNIPKKDIVCLKKHSLKALRVNWKS